MRRGQFAHRGGDATFDFLCLNQKAENSSGKSTFCMVGSRARTMEGSGSKVRRVLRREIIFSKKTCSEKGSQSTPFGVPQRAPGMPITVQKPPKRVKKST